MTKHKIPRWMNSVLMLVLALALAVAIAPAQAARKKIPSKSAQKAALQQAAAAITPMVSGTIAGSPTEESKIPHYFGPFPNWANSPYFLPGATVMIDPPPAGGTTAEAVATVDATGVVTGITVINPGSGYEKTAVPLVRIDGNGSGAFATATVSTNAFTVNVNDGGTGYTAAPAVTFYVPDGAGGTTTVDAAAEVYCEVEAVDFESGIVVGSEPPAAPQFYTGYQLPTVEFSLPQGPDGVRATGYATVKPSGTTGIYTVTGIVVASRGSGYTVAPTVTLRDGTTFDPITGNVSDVQFQTTLAVQTVTVTDPGSGFDVAPEVTFDPPSIGNLAMATASLIPGGAITKIDVTNGSSGYIVSKGIQKFKDQLPMLCDPSVAGSCVPTATLGQYLPLAVPDTTTF